MDTDYINANLVENKFIDRKYILAQGPLRTTCEHFWQMVWEQNTKGIVMLNRLYENGKVCI
jgi:protein tyrosine phosphatase